MSFDAPEDAKYFPLSQSQSLSIRAMSFDGKGEDVKLIDPYCLNPFRSGQCLSTNLEFDTPAQAVLSQSLSIRAMSFDRVRSGYVT